LIDWYYKGQNVLSYYNIRKSTIIGIDAEANFNFFDKTFLNLKYDKIYAADENKNFLPFRSPNSISLRASQKIYDLKLTVQSKWTDKKKVSVAQVDKDIYNQNSTASYFFEKSHFIIDFMFSGCFRKYFNYSIGVNNMLDRRSYPFGPIRGREIFISMSYEFINR
jgi:outer membrane receptor for ferrienterochelin and colicin